jgi:hypothetical protein
LAVGIAVGFALGTIHGAFGPVVWIIEAAILVGLLVVRRARRLGEERAPRLRDDGDERSPPAENAGS